MRIMDGKVVDRASRVPSDLVADVLPVSPDLNLDIPSSDPLTFRLKCVLAPLVLPLAQPYFRWRSGSLPKPFVLLTLGERWAWELSMVRLRRLMPKPERILLAGASAGDSLLQHWLRRRVGHIAAIDICNHELSWKKLAAVAETNFGVALDFRHAPIERLPFENETFDCVLSTAVLEHVSDLPAALRECRRVLRPGGLALHFFGPLYYSFGGDHCIAQYGDDAGYDHLLLDEEVYRKRVNDHDYFKAVGPDEWAHAWATRNQFSFARPQEYLDVFAVSFDIRSLVTVVCPKALAFRRRQPERWRTLLAAGVSEADLLIKGLSVILQKR